MFTNSIILHVILSVKEKQGHRLSLKSLGKRAAQAGLEPATHCLLGRCSTTELPRQLNGWAESRQYKESLSPDKQDKL